MESVTGKQSSVLVPGSSQEGSTSAAGPDSSVPGATVLTSWKIFMVVISVLGQTTASF